MAVDLAHIQCFCQVFVPQSVPAKPSKMDGPSSKLADSFKALQEVATAYIKCPSMSFIYLYNYTMWQTAWKLHCRPSIRDLVTANIASIFVWRHLCMQPGTYMRQIGRTYNWARQSGCVCFNFPIYLSLCLSLPLHICSFTYLYSSQDTAGSWPRLVCKNIFFAFQVIANVAILGHWMSLVLLLLNRVVFFALFEVLDSAHEAFLQL